MDAQTIEKHDALRYRLIIIRTVGFFLLIGGIILTPIVSDRIYAYILTAVIALGSLIFLYGLLRTIFWWRKINRQPQLKQALYNEVYMTYECRSMAGGFGVFIAASLFFGGSIGQNISTSIASYAILFSGVMTYQIAQLIFHRK